MNTRADGMPAPFKIAKWWKNQEGLEEIQRIGQAYGPLPAGKLADIDLFSPCCWACKGPRNAAFRRNRGRWKSYRARNLPLQRCHIKPHALGGSSEPSNLLLMCSDCHKQNPDSNNTALFWRWFGNVETQDVKDQRVFGCLGLERIKLEDHDAFIEALQERLKAENPMIVSGHLSQGFMQTVLFELVEEYVRRQEEPPIKTFSLDSY